jgi:hypothetical protein
MKTNAFRNIYNFTSEQTLTFSHTRACNRILSTLHKTITNKLNNTLPNIIAMSKIRQQSHKDKKITSSQMIFMQITRINIRKNNNYFFNQLINL